MKHFNGRPIRNTASRFKGVYKMQGKECWGAQFFLAKMPKGHWPIHINGDRMDYRKSNLATVPLVLHFGRHRKVTGRCQSIYKGVKRRSENSWQARIVRQHIGSFDNEVDAALAYDE